VVWMDGLSGRPLCTAVACKVLVKGGRRSSARLNAWPRLRASSRACVLSCSRLPRPRAPFRGTKGGLVVDPLGAGLVAVCCALVLTSTEHSTTTNLVLTVIHIAVVLMIMIVGGWGWG
jgi:amino acid transporter